MTEIDTTPYSYAMSLPDFVKNNTMAADPNKARCLITNGTNPVQLCHCVWRKAVDRDDDNLVRLYLP
jgi:hypothetical protein